MNNKMQSHKILISIICAFALIVANPYSYASVGNSTNYIMQADDINAGGGYSISTTYKTEDSAGGIATGIGTSTLYTMSAGYMQADPITISISIPSPVTLTPLSITQHSAVGTTTMTIATNDPAGYSLVAHASQVNAMYASSTAYFTDLSATPTAWPAWNTSNTYKFGFSASGTHTSGFGSGSYCGSNQDTPSTTLLWRGFNGTTDIQIASSTSANAPTGTVTTLCFADAQNTVLAPSGNYSATITLTAVSL